MNKCLVNPICSFNQIPINLHSKQNTSAHRAGDFLLESWIYDYLWNHCFDIGIMYPFAYQLPPLQILVLVHILIMGGDFFTLRQSK